MSSKYKPGDIVKVIRPRDAYAMGEHVRVRYDNGGGYLATEKLDGSDPRGYYRDRFEPATNAIDWMAEDNGWRA